jgi:hypothetical protein
VSLSSLLFAGAGYEQLPQVHLFIGGLDSHYVDNLKHHKNLFVHDLLPEEAKWWSVKPRKRGNWRGAFNYIRCLKLSQRTELELRTKFDGVLVAEDDVVFTNDFWLRFQAVRDAVEADYPGQDYILDCYHRFAKRSKRVGSEKPYRVYGVQFCCTQLMFFTSGAAKLVADFMWSELKGSTRLGYDTSIKRAALKHGLPLLGAFPALAQHIGATSSIGSRGFHITDDAAFEQQDTPQLQYHPNSQTIQYSGQVTSQLLQNRTHITEQLRRHLLVRRRQRGC